VRGVTPASSGLSVPMFVSIHTPVRGVTKIHPALIRNPDCFNPHARAGRDNQKAFELILQGLFQSTRPCGA